MYRRDVVFYTVIGTLLMCACWATFLIWAAWRIFS